jgi:predicted nucleic acid-binding protein
MVTADTNVAIYALAQGDKADRAEAVLASAHFLSVQVLNEYASACRRKLRRDWVEIARDLDLLQDWVQDIRPVDAAANREAVRLAERYQISLYDGLMIAVALANGASILYSEDMQHGLVIDSRLTITNPFLAQPEPL